ncbi:hypothetical protein CMI42_05945 [Candidatus Pacearchaeota archaeon]|nr:hypothetical protein [Candidatus Pacearchaeota archaeon]|tara:strand:+ start:149 stop:919 length:771 start_codon:yes stop_codon:yes gene_type:complete
MKKKGQITLLIIVAIAIIAVIGITFFLTNQSSSNNLESAFSKLGISNQASVVESSILNCLKTAAEDANIVIGIQGGYYNEPQEYEYIGLTFLPYYYNKGNFLQPSIQGIQNELSDFIDNNLDNCIEDLSFNDFNLEFKNSQSKSLIEKNEILFNTDLSLTITKDKTAEQFDLSDYPITIQSSLYNAIEISTFITESHKEDPDLICVSCVAQMAEERDLFVEFLDFDNTDPTTLVVITETDITTDPYIFQFLNRYSS